MLSFCSKQWDEYGPTQITAARGDESSTTAARGGDPMVLAARGVDSQVWTSTARLTGIMTGITTGLVLLVTYNWYDCRRVGLLRIKLVYPHTLIQTYSRAGMLVLIYPSTGCCCVTLQICL